MKNSQTHTVTDKAVSPSPVPTELLLSKAKQGQSYIIVASSSTGRNRMRLDSLGLIPGEAVHVLFSNFAGLVVAIKGSRLALSRSMAVTLTVRPFEANDWPSS